jgi:hypothetical protein
VEGFGDLREFRRRSVGKRAPACMRWGGGGRGDFVSIHHQGLFRGVERADGGLQSLRALSLGTLTNQLWRFRCEFGAAKRFHLSNLSTSHGAGIDPPFFSLRFGCGIVRFVISSSSIPLSLAMYRPKSRLSCSSPLVLQR